MAVYTKLTINDINDFLDCYDIGKCLNFSALLEGTTNSNYLIETDTNKVVLTIFEEIDDVLFLNHAHDVLFQNNFPSAQIIQAITDENPTIKQKPALLFSWQKGASCINPSFIHCKLIGEQLAQLHQLKFAHNASKSKDLVWSIHQASHLLSTDISDDDASLIETELNYLRQHSRLSLPSGFIHADCFRDNVLFDGKKSELKISAIIDFEYATHGAFMFDLAIVINDWCSYDDGSLDRLKMRDVIAAYSKVRPLEPIENQSIPFMLRAAAFRFWISRLSDGEKKHPDEFKRILLNRRKNLSGMQNH